MFGQKGNQRRPNGVAHSVHGQAQGGNFGGDMEMLCDFGGAMGRTMIMVVVCHLFTLPYPEGKQGSLMEGREHLLYKDIFKKVRMYVVQKLQFSGHSCTDAVRQISYQVTFTRIIGLQLGHSGGPSTLQSQMMT